MLLMDGRILGGDAFFYYLGAYTSADGRWKGEILNQEHTPAKGENPVFGGHEVGIGFTGTCDEAGAELEAIALAGKRQPAAGRHAEADAASLTPLAPREKPRGEDDGRTNANPGKITTGAFGEQRRQKTRNREHAEQERAAIHGTPIAAGS